MANSKGSTNVRNMMYSGGKHALLPPKSPFPSVSPPYADYALTPAAIGPPSKAVQKPFNAAATATHQHQRRSSESLIAEEQPSWLDDLLNEPETPVRRGAHRRSSSDSFAFTDSFSNNEIASAQVQDDYNYNYKFKNAVPSLPSWGSSQDFDPRHGSFFAEMNMARQKNSNSRAWEGSLNNPAATSSSGGKDGLVRHGSGSFCVPQEQLDGFPSTANEKYDGSEVGPQDLRNADKNSGSRPSSSDTDTKRAKQQFAQRSRVRKLQYIAELERNVQALQAEGSEVSAGFEFLNQQNLILNMENKALKQRLENLAQEQLIKHLEHEVLEREIGRLRSLYQQQAQPQASSHRRSNSRDLDSQFSNLSLKHKDPNSGRDGQLRI